MHDVDFWSAVTSLVASGKPVGLVVMVDAEGSGPNRPGAKLAVTADGERLGTVGGGRSEFSLAESATAMLQEHPPPPPHRVTMTHTGETGAHASGMICSGEQRFIAVCLGEADRATLLTIQDAYRNNRPHHLSLDANGLHCVPAADSNAGAGYAPDPWCYRETVGIRDTMTLVGGGHVSLALTPLLASLGMRIVILDNRPDLATMRDNVQADECRVVDYTDMERHIPDGDRSYVAIMTFGHAHDETVLAQLVGRPLRYLGMMGSAAKIATIRANLIAQGVAPESLDAIHAPIGLPIASNTPAEIAISIAAEVIAVRNGPIAET